MTQSKQKQASYKVTVNDKITTEENLFNYKRWFNGIKKFSSLKIKRPLDK